MKNNISQKNIPTGWKEVKLSSIGAFLKGASIAKDQLSEKGHNAIRYGELYTRFNFHIKKIYSFIPNEIASLATKVKYGDILFAGSGETNDEIGKSAAYLLKEDAYAGGDIIIFRPKNANSLFLSYFLNIGAARKKLRELGQGQSVVHIYKSDIENLVLCLPPLAEQNRIASILEKWDDAIEKFSKEIEIKQSIKRGLMQKLLTGKTRLPGFTDVWHTAELREVLNYEQPSKYIVEDNQYNDGNKTPVLTANKGFILGYTNETNGIYAKGPAIIFDDFTTDNKFVDFPFKIKSSAIKILTPKSNQFNLRFAFEKLQLINFNVGQHKRHYISEYQYLTIDVPSIREQNAIADVLATADKEVEALERKLMVLQDQKKYLLNNLIAGIIRIPNSTLKVDKVKPVTSTVQ